MRLSFIQNDNSVSVIVPGLADYCFITERRNVSVGTLKLLYILCQNHNNARMSNKKTNPTMSKGYRRRKRRKKSNVMSKIFSREVFAKSRQLVVELKRAKVKPSADDIL